VLTNSSTLAEAVGRALQPGLLSNHHLHRLPALYETFQEWSERGSSDADQIVVAARALAAALERLGIPTVASHLGYTASHTILIQAKPFGPAKDLALYLEEADIILGACRLPGKLGPDGLRLGTQEVVRRGMRTEDLEEVAGTIAALLKREIDPQSAKKRVNILARKTVERSHSDFNDGSISHE
jgi:glycine hydroxymethyltransferase